MILGGTTTARALVDAKRALHAIIAMHTHDALGRCVTCDHEWPCRTYLVAVGVRQ